MDTATIAAPIDGILTFGDSLIIYEDGYYSLDGGQTISADTIGPDTQISSPTSAAVTITLQNANPVSAKRISIGRGNLTVNGTGEILLNNQDVAELSRRSGVRAASGVTITGGARIHAVGFNDGFYVSGLTNTLTVSQNGYLYGECTGTNATITGASKYGVYCGGSIAVEGSGSIEGMGALSSYNTYGVFCDASHTANTALKVEEGSSVSGTASVGVYTGGPTVIGGTLSGTGGALMTSHGIQGDRAGLRVTAGGTVTGTAQDGAYAGILMIYGYEIDGGTVIGTGGRYGARSASSGGITVIDGTLNGTGSKLAGSYGVFVENSDLIIQNGQVRGEGERTGIFAGGSISASDGSTAAGYTYAYGQDDDGYYGAVISGGTIRADGASEIVENYSRKEYFDEAYQIPYRDGKNMTDYRDYEWTVRNGTGAVQSDPDGQGIHATRAGEGTLTAERTGAVAGEVVELDSDSSHIIRIPAEFSVSPIAEYMVTYDANGAACGSVPVDGKNPYREGDVVTVLGNTGNLGKECFCFAGWTLNSAGVGIRYQEGDTFSMPRNDIVLYALWLPARQQCAPLCPPEPPCCF